MRTPLLWIQTDEPAKTIENIVENEANNQNIYMLDAIEGIRLYNSDRKCWVQVLINDPTNGLGVSHDFTDAVQECLTHKGILIIENAHSKVEMLSGLLIAIDIRFRSAIKTNDASKIPGQIILLSHESEVPSEIIRFTQKIEDSLPDVDQLIKLEIQINTSTPLTEAKSDVAIPYTGSRLNEEAQRIAQAGLGLSESEYLSASLGYQLDDFNNTTNFKKKDKAKRISEYKLKLLKDNGILEVRTPDIDINNVGGMDRAKELLDKIAKLWTNPEKAALYNIQPIRRIMMVGVPGVGKSLFCEVASKTLGLDLAKGGVSNSMSKFVGESESNMRRMFATLKAMAPIVFWIDEFGRDMSGGMSSSSVDGGTTDRVHGEFLTGIQELPDNIFMIAAANRVSDLPPEMTRADRFDKVMFAGLPTVDEREEIFQIHINGSIREDSKKSNFSQGIDCEKLAESTPFFTGAEIKALVSEAKFEIFTSEQRMPNTEEIIACARNVKGLVWVNNRDEILEMYNRARVEWDWASSQQLEESDEVLMAGKEKVISHPTSKVGASYKPSQSSPKNKWGH